MLRVLRMVADQPDHEELFMERYGRLLNWALHLAAADKARAEDLLHDAYIQFTLVRPELDLIHNLDAYLFGMLRNLHFANLRRATRRSHRELSLADYDAVSIALRTADQSDQLQLRQELHRICRYACARKQTSKAGSVLLLRFFHGYYPSEIAQITISSRPAVEERLRLARGEVKAYLKDPERFRVIGAEPATDEPVPAGSSTSEDIQRDLYRQIIRSRRGNCLSAAQWQSLYQAADARAIDCLTLAHLTSCPVCLDQANALLGLPPLAERHPVDSLGVETRPKRESGGGGDGGDDDGEGPEGGGGTGGGVGGHELNRFRKRAREVFNHHPSELCIVVNGEVAATQSIGAEHNEQTLHISEEIEFVEVFSEQGIRLLFLNVNELPQRAGVQRQAFLKLSDNREVKLRLDPGSPNSLLQVCYDDPTWTTHVSETVEIIENLEIRNAAATLAESPAASFSPGARPFDLVRESSSPLSAVWHRLLGGRGWFRPIWAAAVVVILLATIFFFAFLRGRPVSAAELLHRSIAADQFAVKDTKAVIHRTVYLTERKGGGVGPVVTRRVESWRNPVTNAALRKVYDDRNQFVIGELAKANGERELLSAAGAGSPLPARQTSARDAVQTGALWRVDPSASDFLSLVAAAEVTQVEEQVDRFLIHYGNRGSLAPPSLIGAVLVLRKADLHGTGLSLTVERGGEPWEYDWTESSSTQDENSSERSLLLDSGTVSSAPEDRPLATTHVATEKLKTGLVVNPTASAELEVEINFLLDQVKANLGEQVNLTRSADDHLHVTALVDSETRKAQIIGVLRPVANDPAVHIKIRTVAEALKEHSQSGRAAAAVKEVEVEQDAFRGSELRRYFFSRPRTDEASADLAMRQFCTRMLGNSRQAIQHAAALNKLIHDFPAQRVRALDPGARTKFLSMIAQHALEYRRNLGELREGLRPLVRVSATGNGAEPAVAGDTELLKASERLLRLSYANDVAVRSGLALSDQGESMDAIKSPEFWESLEAADKLAVAINNAYRR